jgi:hypothetical protein
MTYRQDLWEIAADHHGIVTTRQAEDMGVPSVEMRKLTARGALARMGHGVYRHTGVPTDDWTELTATLASVGEDAFLEGDTVLAMFNLARRRFSSVRHVVDAVRRRLTLLSPSGRRSWGGTSPPTKVCVVSRFGTPSSRACRTFWGSASRMRSPKLYVAN